MLKIFEDFYKRGYEAGVTAQKLEQREDFERRLTEMYHFGMAMGKQEMLDEMGAIEIDDIVKEWEAESDRSDTCKGLMDENCTDCSKYWNCPYAVIDDIELTEAEVMA